MAIGERIKTLRKSLKLTQQQFAKALDIDQGHIAGIEKGSKNPSKPLQKVICLTFYVNDIWLKTGEGEMFITPEESLKSQKARFGEQAFVQAVGRIMRETSVPSTDSAIVDSDMLLGNNKVADAPPPTIGTVDQGNPQAFINEAIDRYGATAVIETFQRTMKERGLAVAVGHQNHRANTGDPELDQMINILYDLWAAGDDMKGWLKVQFRRAFPADVVEEVQKKQQETKASAC